MPVAEQQRRPRRWGDTGGPALWRRWALATAAMAVGLYAGSQSFALAVRHSATDLALRLAPGDARILAVRAETGADNAGDAKQWTKAAVPARAALLRDPLLPSAAATLGFQAGLRGDDAAARRAFAYSQSISRRDLKTHLWAIEFMVAKGDIGGALRHYDLALRTSRQAPDILFPVLAGAVTDAEVRRALVPVLLAQPVWARPFVNHVAMSSPDRGATTALFSQLRARGFPFPDGAEASLLGALVSDRNYVAARAYLTAGQQDAKRDAAARTSRHPRFAGNPNTPSPFDWNLQNDVGVDTSIQQGDTGGIFAFSAVTGAGGPVLRQLHLLPPGRYEIVSRLTALEPAGALPVWTVQCVDGGGLARVPVSPDGGSRTPAVAGQFTVSADCPAQWLVFAVTPSDVVGGVVGEMDFAQIRPVAGGG